MKFYRFFIVIVICLFSISASAGYIEFVNKTGSKIELAIAYKTNYGGWVSEGWWPIYNNGTTVVHSNYNGRYLYYYYKFPSKRTDVTGDYYFCIPPSTSKGFKKSYADGNCYQGKIHGFSEIDRGVYDKNLEFTLRTNSNCKGNCEDGYGTAYSSGKTLYKGNWENGKMHGYGISYSSGDMSYKGNWKNGEMHGSGILYNLDGFSYSGNWRNSQKNGYGTETYSNGTYNGYFKNNKRHGQGTYKFNNGNKYVGNFKNGQRTGEGTYYWTNGETWEGMWDEGDREGYGVYTYSDGTIKKGFWVNSEWKYHGQLFLILVVNTSNLSVGKNAEKIKRELKGYYRQIAKIGKFKFRYKIISSSSFTYQNTKNYLNNFSCEANDVVVFHYFGHGGRTSTTTDRWPLMKLENHASLSSVGLSLSYVKEKLYNGTKARLGLFFADCCNTSSTTPEECVPTQGPATLSNEISEQAVKRLFLHQKGFLIASSSSEGEFSSVEPNGTSIYTIAFKEAMEKYLKQNDSDWSDIMDNIKKEVFDLTKNCEYHNTKQTPQSKIRLTYEN